VNNNILNKILESLENIEKDIREEDTLNKINNLKNEIKQEIVFISKNFTEIA